MANFTFSLFGRRALLLLALFSLTTIMQAQTQDKISPVFGFASLTDGVVPQSKHVNMAKIGKQVSAKQKKANEESTVEVLIDEDFVGCTKGTIDVQNEDDFMSAYYIGGDFYVYEGLTHEPGWSSLACLEAGGAAGLSYPFLGGCLNTPLGNYSGDLTISFRLYVPESSRSYKSHTVFVNVVKGDQYYPVAVEDMASTFTISFTSADLDEEGWLYKTINYSNSYNGNDCFVQFNCQYDAVVIDDIKITTDRNFLSTPILNGFSDFQRDGGFTASWQPVAGATDYLLSAYELAAAEGGEPVNTTETFESITIDENGTITGGVPEGWTLNVGNSGNPQVVEDETNGKAVNFSSVDDAIYLPTNGGNYQSLSFSMRCLSESSDSYVSIQGWNGNKWADLGFFKVYNSQRTGWRDIDYSMEVKDVCTQVRLIAYDSKWDGAELLFDNFHYELAASQVKTQILTDEPVADTCYVFTGLNPEADYYVSVKARDTERSMVSAATDYELAFGISTPVALAATEINPNGSFTANWEYTPKTSYYEVQNLAVSKVKEDKNDYVILEEDFSFCGEEGVFYNFVDTSLDAFADNKGWTGLLNCAENSALGGASYYGIMCGYLISPALSLQNDGGKCQVKITAKGSAGDYLIVQNKAGKWNAMPLSGDYTTTTLELDGCSDREYIIFSSYNGQDFYIDYVVVTQNVKAGDQIIVTGEKATIEESETTSYTFTGLDTNPETTYAYEVVAYYTKGTDVAVSDVSERILVDLNATGINLTSANENVNEPLYNLNGQRVSNNYKGIVVRKGRKTINK